MKRAGFLEVQAEALERLAGGELPPLLVLTGEEPFLAERLVAAVRERAGAAEVFAQQPGESDADATRRLLAAWTTPSLFAPRQCLVARDADRLLTAGGAKALAEVLEAPAPPPHHLVLTASAVDGRSKLAKLLKSSDGLVALPPLRDAPPPWEDRPTTDTELNRWVLAEARDKGLQLDLAAADALTRRVGNEPARLSRQLDQLGVLCAGARAISARDVDEHVPHTSARLLGLYEDALRRGAVAEALTLLDRMLGDGVYDHGMRLVSGAEAIDTVLRGLLGNLARVLAAHEQLDDGLLSALRSKPWQRSRQQTEALDAVLGRGGPRVYVERDVRVTTRAGVRAAFDLALAGMRALRDGEGVSLHALTVRLGAALAGGGRRR